MCDPVIASVALTAASGIMNYQAQRASAKYQNALAIEAADSAKQAMFDQSQQTALRVIQEEQASSQQMEQVKKEAAEAVSRTKVSAGEAGISGLSLDMLMRDYFSQELGNIDTLETNYNNMRQQTGWDMRGIQANAASRVNSASSSMVAPPSMLGTALEIGADSLALYNANMAPTDLNTVTAAQSSYNRTGPIKRYPRGTR